MWFVLGFFIILFLLCFYMLGENGSNRYCAKANACTASVRCTAKNNKECECFECKK